MFSQEFISSIIDFLTTSAADWLLPSMLFVFTVGVVLRGLVYYTVSREYWFAREFYKRVHQYLDDKDIDKSNLSFYVMMKQNLEKTFYESFVVRAYMKRRNPDYVMDITDRVFLVQQGCARLVKETLRQVKFLRHTTERPRFIELTKNVFENNPCFKKILGIIPVSGTHDVLNILPGIFIIGGIFGTFLGIMGALPELGEMKLEDVEGAKSIMDNFLTKISFSMSTSIIGIIVSVLMTFINTLLDPEKMFIKTVNKFENTMELAWDVSVNNSLPADIPDFNEHRDPLEALAEDAVENEVAGNKLVAPAHMSQGVAQNPVHGMESVVDTTISKPTEQIQNNTPAVEAVANISEASVGNEEPVVAETSSDEKVEEEVDKAS